MGKIIDLKQFMKVRRLVVAVAVLNVREYHAKPFSKSLRVSDFIKV